MKVSQLWLNDHVTMDPEIWTPTKVSQVLTDLGLEVEHITDMSAALRGFVVGRVFKKEPHPKADKLSVCTVDVGDGRPRTIVCGAPNVEAGQLVAVALVGAVVPSANFMIESRALRGITSEGMICSQSELGLGDEHDGIWVLTTSAAVGTPLATALGIDDVVYDVAITPNRADCLSHSGIARELRAYMYVHNNGELALDLSSALQKSVIPGASQGPLHVSVQDPHLCPHYIGHVVTNVRAVESPQWLKDRLTSIGLRPRNVIVDVTNYINMEMGQPLHAFDASKLADNTIVVRRARADEKTCVTLDGKERALTTDMLMICDASHPIAIAGVMGGQNSEVDEHTSTVVIESAFFAPSSIRRTAKTHGLSTDASYRFERGVDPGAVRNAANRAVQMLCDLAGGSAGQRIEVGAPPADRKPISVSYDRICALVGISVPGATITKMLKGVGCAVEEAEAGLQLYNVVPPSWRADITIEADLAEEVMRLYGIDNIPSSTMVSTSLDAARLPDHLRAGGALGLRLRNHVRNMLVARGYYDCVTHVLTSPEEIGATVLLKNALGRDFSAMRASGIPALLRVASRNLRHGQQTIRLMEIGSQFSHNISTELGIQQQEALTLLVTGLNDPHWSGKPRSLDLYDLLGELTVIAPNIEAVTVKIDDGFFTQNVVELRIGGVTIGQAGEVQPEIAAQCDIDGVVVAAVVYLRAIPAAQPMYTPVGQFPSVRRDLALIVKEEVTAGRIIEVIRMASPVLLREVGVFDVYRDTNIGAGMKSVGIGMTFRSEERTLVDIEVDSAVESIITAASQTLGARVRGSVVDHQVESYEAH